MPLDSLMQCSPTLISMCVGIISCLAYSPDANGVLAAGSYSGVAAIYDTHMRSATCTLAGHNGGITQVRASPPGNIMPPVILVDNFDS